LSVVQHDKKIEESKKPQRRTVIERSQRASIYDRFGLPLATNKVQYNALIAYAPIRDIPRWIWKEGEDGKRYQYNQRKEYVTTLAQKLSEELHLDAKWIEDMVHSKAAILGNVPCLIKENISEGQYFRLKMMAKDWPGVMGEVAAKRCYPLGPIGGEVVGYIGPISRSEYETITREMGGLREILLAYEETEDLNQLEGYCSIQEVKNRLEELEKKAYRINDCVGKMGVEAAYDEALRGLCGKHIYLADTHGNYLRELPGSQAPVPGSRLVLSVSAELQAFAQQLLAEYDTETFSTHPTALKRRALIPENQPWIKGGAIVAIDPKSGEVYAIASFPTFDPNDFIRPDHGFESAQKNRNVHKWLETDIYLGKVWDMKIPYSRPRFDEKHYYEEQLEMSWNTYLSFILPKGSPVRETLETHGTVADAIWLQRKVDQLVSLFKEPHFSLSAPQIFDFIYDGQNIPTHPLVTLQQKAFMRARSEQVGAQISLLKNELAPYFALLLRNDEKLLLTDLYRLCVDATTFTPFLTELVGLMSLSEYRDVTARFSLVSEEVRKIAREIYLENEFAVWREKNFKEYLAKKRLEEKEEKKKYARPYLDYLDALFTEHFQAFWQERQWKLIASFLNRDMVCNDPYATILRNWAQELEAGAHQGLEWTSSYHRLRKLVDELNSPILIGFLKTLRSFDQLNRPLIGKYTNLLTRGNQERDLATAFFPAYGMGFARSHAFRQAATIGSMFKIIPAYEALRQRYLQLKERGEAGSLNPLTIIDDKRQIPGKENLWNVGYTLEGKPIPMFYHGGRLPRSDHAGIGKVDLVKALEASSNPYFAILAGDVLNDPEDLCHAAHLFGFGEKSGIDLPGEYAGRLPLDVSYNRTGLYSLSIGQHTLVGTPLQAALMLATLANGGSLLKPHVVQAQVATDKIIFSKPEVRRRVFMPKPIQELLLSGLRQVVCGEKGTARLLRKQYAPGLISEIIGKTSTSEVIERMSLDGTHAHMKLKHVWFGAVSYDSDDFSNPELVVVVYLRYGEWGKDAAPLAVEMIKKWRSLKQKYY
jgi:cell division protein FtsI/penicillin-binding protein 2